MQSGDFRMPTSVGLVMDKCAVVVYRAVCVVGERIVDVFAGGRVVRGWRRRDVGMLPRAGTWKCCMFVP